MIEKKFKNLILQKSKILNGLKKPKKLEIRKYVNLSQPWNLTFLEDEIFELFFNHMSQKYQNEKSPILNGLRKPKTSEKVQKMRDFEGPASFRPFENTLYSVLLTLRDLKHEHEFSMF